MYVHVYVDVYNLYAKNRMIKIDVPVVKYRIKCLRNSPQLFSLNFFLFLNFFGKFCLEKFEFVFSAQTQDITSASLAPDRKRFIAGGPADQVCLFFFSLSVGLHTHRETYAQCVYVCVCVCVHMYDG